MNVEGLRFAGFAVTMVCGCAVVANRSFDSLDVRVRYNHKTCVYSVYLMDDTEDYHVMHECVTVEEILEIVEKCVGHTVD